MVKATITDNPKDESIFPLLAKDVNSNLTVLFITEHKGTVIIQNNEHPMGEYNSDWCKCFNDNEWIILSKGTIIKLEVL